MQFAHSQWTIRLFWLLQAVLLWTFLYGSFEEVYIHFSVGYTLGNGIGALSGFSKLLLCKYCRTEVQSGCCIHSCQWWMGGFSGSTLSTLGVGVWLLGVVEVPECIVVFLFISVFRALAPVMALGWVPRLLSAPIRDGFMSRRRSRSKTGVCFWKKIPKEHDGTLLGFLAVAFVEDISILGHHPLGHFWWKLIQICPFVTHFFF